MPALISSPIPVIFSPAMTPTISQAISGPNSVLPGTISRTRMRRPIGFSSGNSRLARVWLMSATGGRPAVSVPFNARPASSLMPSAWT